MADMMRQMPPQPMGGTPGMGGARLPQAPQLPNESMLNPMDLAKKASMGEIRPGMTIRELFERMGVDVDGPIEQLQGAIQSQAQNATMAGKIRGAPAGGPAGQGAPAGGPGPGGGIMDVMQTLRGPR